MPCAFWYCFHTEVWWLDMPLEQGMQGMLSKFWWEIHPLGNLEIHNINTRNKHHLHRPNAN
jgi:hypothetical protein